MTTTQSAENVPAIKGAADLSVATSASDEALDRRIMLHMPVDVRSASLAFLAIAAGIAMLRWTQDFIVPVLLGVVLSYTLTPLVDRLESRRVPRMAGAGFVLVVMLAACAVGTYALRGQADEFLTRLPQLAAKVRQSIVGSAPEKQGTIARVELAAVAIQSVATGQTTPPDLSRAHSPSPEVRAALQTDAKPSFDSLDAATMRSYLVSGTLEFASFAGKALVVIFVALLLLATGDGFRRKMVKLAGPTLSQRRVTVQALDEVHSQIQRYLLVQLVTSVLVGIVTAGAFFWIGLDNAAVWGVVAGVANLVPYVGSVAISGLAAVAGLVQFGEIGQGLWLAAASFAIHLIVGNLVTPWLTGHTSKMSPFAVFVGVLFFGWLWGIAGLIVAFPILVTVKITCDRVDDLKPIGELLGG